MEKLRNNFVRSLGFVVAGIAFFASLFFLSPNVTGNVIGGMNLEVTNLFGMGLFVLSLFLLYFTRKLFL